MTMVFDWKEVKECMAWDRVRQLKQAEEVEEGLYRTDFETCHFFFLLAFWEYDAA